METASRELILTTIHTGIATARLCTADELCPSDTLTTKTEKLTFTQK